MPPYFSRMKNHLEITHKEALKLIPDFITGQLTLQETEMLMNHIDHCPDCKEELAINFLISAGLAGLERDGNINLQEELDQTLENARHKIRMHHFLHQTIIALEIVGIVALLAVAVWIIVRL
ncbi:MAG: zf-HC2 domain-containing protein [Lachnospiraceae bacterium]|nr:zf-HC2 domain-containing protein [Lachnospiraceae bacterium]